MSATDRFGLSLDEAIPVLNQQLADFRDSKNRPELKDIDADTAFELGYETAIHDLKKVTGENPLEIQLVIAHVPEEEAE